MADSYDRLVSIVQGMAEENRTMPKGKSSAMGSSYAEFAESCVEKPISGDGNMVSGTLYHLYGHEGAGAIQVKIHASALGADTVELPITDDDSALDHKKYVKFKNALLKYIKSGRCLGLIASPPHRRPLTSGCVTLRAQAGMGRPGSGVQESLKQSASMK